MNDIYKMRKNKSVKAMLKNENIWVKDFDPKNMTGILDNHPLTEGYELGSKVKLENTIDGGIEYLRIIKKI